MDGQVEIGRLIWLNSRKVRRRHADDRIGEILNRKRLTDDFFIRVKRTSPVVKAQNDNGGTVWSFIIAWSKEMAENWPCAEDGEISAGHELSVRRRSSPIPHDIESSHKVVGHHPGEHAALAVDIVGGEFQDVLRCQTPGGMDKHELFGILDRQFAKQEGIEDGKHGRVCANRQRQSRYGCRREPWILP